MARSILAVAAGFVFIAALSVGADLVLRAVLPGAFLASGRMESVPALLLVQGYVAVFAVAGCYLAARLAPDAPMRHALILGALGLVFNVVGALTRWEMAPAWYHVVAIALVMPYAWAGGRLREAELARRGGAVVAG